MIDPQTLEMLRCPVSKSKLSPASAQLVEWINQQISSGNCKDSGGNMIRAAIDSALVNDERTLAMPIQAGVISLSANRAISVQDFSEGP